MTSLNFIGGEKGGVGKSVVARVLAQYVIDKGRAFTGFDTDRSHASFTRFYADYAAPVVVDSYEGLDTIAGEFEALEDGSEEGAKCVIVDLAAQTAAPLARWIQDSDLLDKLLATYGAGPNYFVVRNLGRGSDFKQLDQSDAMSNALALDAKVITLPCLHEASMRKIDRQNSSFWAACNAKQGPDALGLLERQRVRTWLKNAYAALDSLALA